MKKIKEEKQLTMTEILMLISQQAGRFPMPVKEFLDGLMKAQIICGWQKIDETKYQINFNVRI